MKNLWRKLFITIWVTFLAALLVLFLFRDNLLSHTVSQKTNHFNKNHTAKVYYKNVAFKSLKSIQIDSLIITTSSNDTLLFIGSTFAEINLRQLITGSIAFSKLYIENSQINIDETNMFAKNTNTNENSKHGVPSDLNLKLFTDESKISEYLGGFSKADSIHTNVASPAKFNERIEHFINRVFIALPKELTVKDFTFSYLHNSIKIGAFIELLQLKDEKLTANLTLIGNPKLQSAIVEGTISARKRAFEIMVYPHENEPIIESSLAELFGAEVKFKSLTFGFNEKEHINNTFCFEGTCSLGQFEVDYRPLSSKNITFPGCTMKFEFAVGENYVEIDSLSEIKMGTLKLHPYLKYSRGNADSLAFSCYIPAFATTDFFNSIPAELFPNIKYFEADGRLSYRTRVAVNFNEPDSLRFESHLNTDNFRISNFDDELLKMDTSFVYTAFENGDTMRTIVVGTENPIFLPLGQIPLLLQNAILAAEDIEFYSHHGFLTESIRFALAQNIKEKKFIRGGSTISQQLVKNVYLSREKTLSRKFEEIVLVWLIESNQLVTKSRMFEVYLNIIEWGPNVYGVNEASQFYFKKNASQLNESECIFLASVIPSPKKFYWRFNKQGELAPFMRQYYINMAEKLYKWQYLNSANGDSLASLLHINGLAKEYFKTDSTRVDSIILPYTLFEE